MCFLWSKCEHFPQAKSPILDGNPRQGMKRGLNCKPEHRDTMETENFSSSLSERSQIVVELYQKDHSPQLR